MKTKTKLLMKGLLFMSFIIFITNKIFAQVADSPSPGKQVVSDFYSNIHGGKIKFHLYLPQKYNTVQRSNSLLIFLHGIDEVGTEIEKVLRFGPPSLANQGKQFPMIIISPQQPHFVGGVYQPRFNTALINELIRYAIKTYKVDTTRIYMTGLSMGGNGCWRFAEDYPNVLAAMVPICGQTIESETNKDLKLKACRIKNIPVKVFHGAKDNVVDVHHSIDMVQALNACKPSPHIPPQLIMYENTAHDSWTPTYANIDGVDNIYSWMMSFRNPDYISRISEAHTYKEVNLKLQKICRLPVALKESSGVIAVGKNKFWSHNDSGNAPVLFSLDSMGKIIETITVVNASNVDWEDITRDDRFFYIGDFGNNGNSRKRLQIYKIPDLEQQKEERIKAEIIDYNYADQSFPTLASNRNYDVESMISFNDSLFLFTKNRTQPFSGYVYVYKLPKKPGTYTAIKKDSLLIGKGSMMDWWITSAAISPDGKNLTLLSHNKLWIFSCFKGSHFFSGDKTLINFDFASQKEGISFVDNDGVFISEERLFPFSEGNLYYLNLQKYLKSQCIEE